MQETDLLDQVEVTVHKKWLNEKEAPHANDMRIDYNLKYVSALRSSLIIFPFIKELEAPSIIASRRPTVVCLHESITKINEISWYMHMACGHNGLF